MSGIAAVLHRDGRPADADLLRALTAAAPHRGPDGASFLLAGPAGLAHQLLRTTPENAVDRQPLRDDASGVHITFDGRIDNRTELAATLESSGATFRRGTDAELALRAYERWGAECPLRLLGDFALIVWDARQRVLFCARDVMAVRPLYYVLRPDLCACASEPRQFIAAGIVAPEPNEAMVAEYLADRIRSADETIYRDVRRLPAAHTLTVSADGSARSRYWSLEVGEERRYATDAEYAEEFRAIFTDAVRCRLRTDRPVAAAFLSGGLDSSAVVGTAHLVADETGVPPPETFSLVFHGDPACDESAYIRDVLDMWRAPAHVMEPDAPDGRRCRRQIARRLEPMASPFEQIAGSLRARIAERGARVVLTGCGGDHAFAGSLFHYADLLRAGRFLAAARQMRDDVALEDYGWTAQQAFAVGVLPLVPRPLKRLVGPVARRLGWPGRVPSWIDRAFAARTGLEARLHPPAPPRWPASFSRAAVADGFSAAALHVPLEETERVASEFELEERHPFLDRRVVEFAVALPESQRWRGDGTKVVLRNALAPLLPASVRTRRDKADFSAQAFRVLESLGGRRLVDDLRIGQLGWVDQAEVSALYREMRRRFHGGDPRFSDRLFPMWAIAGVELWYRFAFLREAPAAPLSTARRSST